jgi:hypothetical protein
LAQVRRLSAIVVLLASLAGASAFPAGCDGLVGSWDWFTRSVVTFRADHVILYDGNRAGTWECTDAAKGSAKLRWTAGFIDSITVAGDRISGVNQQGVSVSGARRASAAPGNPHTAPPPATSSTHTGSPQPPAPAGPLQTADTAPLDQRLAAGWCVMGKSNYQQQSEFLNSVLSRNSRDAEALYYRGR